jgi:hypothetical protein
MTRTSLLGRRESLALPPPEDIRGTLYLVGRKTGADMQSYPIDGDKVTFGRCVWAQEGEFLLMTRRDYDSDVNTG